jgi:hypothetical protein
MKFSRSPISILGNETRGRTDANFLHSLYLMCCLGIMNTVSEHFHYNVSSVFLYCLDVSQSRHVLQFKCGEFSFLAVCNRPCVKVF